MTGCILSDDVQFFICETLQKQLFTEMTNISKSKIFTTCDPEIVKTFILFEVMKIP